MRDAARAGVQPPPGQLHALTLEALSPVLLVLVWATVSLLGGVLGESYGSVVACILFVGWVALYMPARRRTARVVAAMPELGRPRVLKPVRQVLVMCSAVMALLALTVLGLLYPITQDHAVDIGLARSKPYTKTVVIYPGGSVATSTETIAARASTTDPAEVPPTTPLASPSVATVTRSTPTSPTYEMPVIRDVRFAAKDNPRRAWALMSYFAAAATATLFIAGLLGLQAQSLAGPRAQATGSAS